ncbi:MAG: NHL repeat-containing protein [Candidatus Eisenbacteria bacterium]|uniref:NHL repeat-containing protein n=1 Tax=Eiseniibacteriota bacterium TaxID=2212470 RepID=A0A948RTG4_UNCEI|nr:NHL repeat-containing protein [Candidatus Eisenbacteria bacterium]
MKSGIPAVILAALTLIFIAACGQKFDLPPQPEPGRLPEPGTYNLFTIWPMEAPTDIAVRGSYIFVIQNESELSAYLSYRKDVAPATVIEPFNGLIQPVRIAIAKRDSTFVIVADKGDMTIKRYFYLGGDPVHTFTDSTWVEFSGLTADAYLNVYIADATRDSILVYDDQGHFKRLLSDRGTGSGYVIAPHGLDHNGDMVIVADTEKNWVQRLDPDTTNIALFSRPIGLDVDLLAPFDVAADPNAEFIFVADTQVKNDTLTCTRVLKFLTTGAFEDTVYTATKIDLNFPIIAPSFVASWNDLDADFVYVSDPLGNRVVVLQLVSQ